MVKRHYHIPELQSVRGIAALTVLMSHSSFLFITTARFHYWSEIILNAHAAVILFFVLSGYVLSRSLSGGELTLQRVIGFYLHRLFRIYPALWAACGLALLYLFLIHFRYPTLEASKWYGMYFVQFPSPGQLLLNISIANGPLIPPSWSIFDELIGSAVIPVLVLANRRGAGLGLLAVTIAIAVLRAKAGHLGTLIYLPSFSMGAIACRYQDRLKPIFRNPVVLVLCLIGVQFFRRINPDWRFDANYTAVVPALVESLFAAGLVLSLVSSPVTMLRGALLTWLGDISYSLYLYHFTVMSALAKPLGMAGLTPDIRATALMAGTLVLTLMVSSASYLYIEKPGIAAGKKAIGSLTARATIQQAL